MKRHISIVRSKLASVSTLALAVGVLIGSPLLFSSPQAFAASAGELCANSGTGKCVEATTLSPSNLVMENDLAGGYQRLLETPANICNGLDNVTTTCPLQDHSLDAWLANHGMGARIFELQFNQDHSKCVLGVPSIVRIGACGSNGTYWIVTNDQLDNANAFVSVYDSNQTDDFMDLTSSGVLGGPVEMQHDADISGGFASWGWVYK